LQQFFTCRLNLALLFYRTLKNSDSVTGMLNELGLSSFDSLFHDYVNKCNLQWLMAKRGHQALYLFYFAVVLSASVLSVCACVLYC